MAEPHAAAVPQDEALPFGHLSPPSVHWPRVITGYALIGAILLGLGLGIDTWADGPSAWAWILPTLGEGLLIIAAFFLKKKSPAGWKTFLSVLQMLGTTEQAEDQAKPSNAGITANGGVTGIAVGGTGNIVNAGPTTVLQGLPSSAHGDQVPRRFLGLVDLLEQSSEILDLVDNDGKPVVSVLSTKSMVDELLVALKNGARPDAYNRRTLAPFVEAAARLKAYRQIASGAGTLNRLAAELRLPSAVDRATTFQSAIAPSTQGTPVPHMRDADQAVVKHDFKVEGGSHHAIDFTVDEGEELQGSFRADAPIDVFMMKERAYLSYWETRDPSGARRLAEQAMSGLIRWRAPKGGKWHMVFDTYGKQSQRNVIVELRRVRA